MLKVHQLVFNPFEENTYILADTESGKAAVVDPGMLYEKERRAFDRYVTDNNLEITQIINTHLHLDHCVGISHVKSHYGAKLAASSNDASLGDHVMEQAANFGLSLPDELSKAVSIDIPLKDGDTISIGNNTLLVITVPGHSQGGIALYDAKDGFVVTGDSLFRGSIGRTDLPGGNHPQLVNSVRDKLLTLPPDTLVYPGHGPMSTVALELSTNPFVR